MAAAREVDNATAGRREQMLEGYCLYGDETALPGNAFDFRASPPVTRNLLASAIDTVVTEITQTRPRPMFVTIGGDWLEQERARNLTKFTDAEFDASNVHELTEQGARDGAIAGLGILRPRIDPASKCDLDGKKNADGKRHECRGTKVIIERVFPPFFLVDDRGCVDVLPRCWYVRHMIDKWHLAELYPDCAEEIEKSAAVSTTAWYSDGPRSQDKIEVIEAIHLPSRRDKSDGRHVLVTNDSVLMDVGYKHDEPPFVGIRAIRPLRGYWGLSVAQRAASTQTQLNKLVRRFDESLRLNATALWFINRQSRALSAHMVNGVGTMVMHDGPPPHQFTPAIMHPQVDNYIDKTSTLVFKLCGASEMAAMSLKPAGLNAGVAIREYNDLQSRRFLPFERNFERAYTEIAKWVVLLHTEIAEDHPDHEIVASDGPTRTNRIKWSEINLEQTRYRCRVFPASAFPTSPAAKMQMLQEMLQQGAIDQQTFYELADMPDFESARDRVMAPLQLLHKRFAKMLYENKYLGPESYMDLQLAMKECALAIQRAEVDDCPEERVDLLRDFLAAVEALLPKPPAPPEMPPMPPEMPPEMTPEMPPEMSPEGMLQ